LRTSAGSCSRKLRAGLDKAICASLAATAGSSAATISVTSVSELSKAFAIGPEYHSIPSGRMWIVPNSQMVVSASATFHSAGLALPSIFTGGGGAALGAALVPARAAPGANRTKGESRASSERHRIMAGLITAAPRASMNEC
jgi:hypothetical protein